MSKSKRDKLSVFISLVLRHKPEAANIELDNEGWADTSSLLKGINETGREIDLEILKQIVGEDTKDRYSFSEDLETIRANQGHSVNVDIKMESKNPTSSLYHGTSEDNLELILKQGIKSMSRKYVHLSDNIETAVQVGKRHGDSVVLVIDAIKMVEDGEKFFISENGVWQYEGIVDPKYILKIETFHPKTQGYENFTIHSITTIHASNMGNIVERLKSLVENQDSLSAPEPSTTVKFEAPIELAGTTSSESTEYTEIENKEK